MNWCNTSVSVFEVTNEMFLSIYFDKWLKYRKAYCSKECRDFKAHVIPVRVRNFYG